MAHQQKRSPLESDTLFVYNIPENKNKIPLLFKHFKRYGHIKSIWCNGKVASIGYTTVEEAVTAYHSPEAYQNNRFVFIKYHRNPAEAECRLSLAADMEKVKKVAEEVKEKMKEQQKIDEENINKAKLMQKISEYDEKIQEMVKQQSDLQKMADSIIKRWEIEKDETKKNSFGKQILEVKNLIAENNVTYQELLRRKEELKMDYDALDLDIDV